MAQRWLHSSFWPTRLAAICVLLASADGCSMGKADRWSLDRYRDQRAVEIEQHLDRGEPIVKSPF